MFYMIYIIIDLGNYVCVYVCIYNVYVYIRVCVYFTRVFLL